MSMFEILAGELRARLLSNQADRMGSPRAPRGLAAAPMGGGWAWPDNESTRRAKLAARTVNGRAAAHGHTTQHGLSGQASRWPEIWRQPEIR